jgi:Protein of unknown function (DUF3579)
MEATLIGMVHAASQHEAGNMAHLEAPALRPPRALPHPPLRPLPMSATKPREVFIQGLTLDGKTFRPSDWSERLAGAMSCFRPDGGKGGISAYIGYSPYCVPRVIDGVKCVLVNEALRDLEPMAWDFVMNFARDNHLQVTEAGFVADAMPEEPPPLR